MMKKIFFVFFFGMSLLVAGDIRIGSENTYKPFAYLNEQNEATGFDNEVVKLLVSSMPDSKAVFISIPWNAIFTGLDSGKFDVVANQITKTPERESKYVFSRYPYFYGLSGLIVRADSQAKDLSDLNGAKIGVSVGSNHATNLEAFVQKNPQANIQIVYYKTTASLMADLANGRIAGMINDAVSALGYAKVQGSAVKTTGFYFEKTPVYLLFRKDSQALQQAFDEALKQALQNGKIVELVESYFGQEYALLMQDAFKELQ